MSEQPNHILYIVMRKDLYDNNPGKMMAQAAHAGTKFVFDMKEDGTKEQLVQLEEWAGGYGFGTKVVLEATQEEIINAIDSLGSNMGSDGDTPIFCGAVYDPTYPYSNYYGKRFTAYELTCMYAFVPEDRLSENLLGDFPLHK